MIIFNNPFNNPLDIQDKDGQTLLHRATLSGDMSKVQALIDMGAKTSITTRQTRSKKYAVTSIHIAISNQYTEILSSLLMASDSKAAMRIMSAEENREETPIQQAIRIVNATGVTKTKCEEPLLVRKRTLKRSYSLYCIFFTINYFTSLDHLNYNQLFTEFGLPWDLSYL